MERKAYTINKGVNRPISFKGLQGQYILYLGSGLLLLLLLFAVSYVLGISFWISSVACGFLGYLLVEGVSRMNRKYGEHGLKKKWARRKVPMGLKIHDRGFVKKLETKDHGKNRH